MSRREGEPGKSTVARLAHGLQARPSSHQRSWFERFAKRSARAAGRPAVFATAVGLIMVWALVGPWFGFTDSWQLVINTATTIVTFLMVFLIQNTQNRDAEAVQVKLDELIRAIRGAHNALLDLEEMGERDLERIRSEYERLARRARVDLERGKIDTGVPRMKLRDRPKQPRDMDGERIGARRSRLPSGSGH